MTTAARIDGDCRITGNLNVDGTIPDVARSGLTQESNAVYAIPATAWRVWDAMNTILPAASANDDIGIYGGTFGTNSPVLGLGDVKAAGALTRYARAQFVLPVEYVAGETITIRASAGCQTTAADTSCTLDVECYAADREAGISADLCTTSAQSMNSTTFADLDFTITPTGRSPGDVLDVRLTIACNDGATGTAVDPTLGAVELLVDIKG